MVHLSSDLNVDLLLVSGPLVFWCKVDLLLVSGPPVFCQWTLSFFYLCPVCGGKEVLLVFWRWIPHLLHVSTESFLQSSGLSRSSYDLYNGLKFTEEHIILLCLHELVTTTYGLLDIPSYHIIHFCVYISSIIPVWSSLHQYGPHNTSMVFITPLWSSLHQYGIHYTSMVLITPVCSSLHQCGPYYTSMFLITPVCSSLHQYVPHYTSMVLITPVWHYDTHNDRMTHILWLEWLG